MPKKVEEKAPDMEAPVKVAPTEAPEAEQENPKTESTEQVEQEAPVQEETKEESKEETKESPKEETKKEAPARGRKNPIPSVEPAKPEVKKVKVILTEDIDSLINGVRYQFPAKKMVEIPEDVAQILVFGKKGYRM